MKVKHLINERHRLVKNHFVVELDSKTILYSYESSIVMIDAQGQIHLSAHWDYSATTIKNRELFLGEPSIETQKKIKNGEYKMDLGLDGKLIS